MKTLISFVVIVSAFILSDIALQSSFNEAKATAFENTCNYFPWQFQAHCIIHGCYYCGCSCGTVVPLP